MSELPAWPLWRDAALCAQVGPEEFFPEPGDNATRARAVCGRCPSQAPCLTFALDTFQNVGIWSGTDPVQRVKLRRERRAVA